MRNLFKKVTVQMTTVFVAVTLFCSLLTGCGKFADKTEYSADIKEKHGVTIDSNHASGKLSCGIKVDAGIIQDNNTQWKEYRAVKRQFSKADSERIQGVFSNNVSSYEEYDNGTEAGGKMYIYNLSDGSVSVSDGSISYRKNYVPTYNYGAFFENDDVIADRDVLAERFPNESIDGIEKEDVIKKFTSICKTLNINISDDIQIYAMDADTANNFRKENELIFTDKNNKKTPDWTKKDESYYIIAPIMVGDALLPMQRESHLTQPSVVNAAFNKEGLIYFYVSGIYDIAEEKTVAEVCSANDVLNVLEESYSSIGNICRNITFTEFRLQYVAKYYSLNHEYRIKPSWVCTQKNVVSAVKDGQKYENITTRDVYIDAQSKNIFSK